MMLSDSIIWCIWILPVTLVIVIVNMFPIKKISIRLGLSILGGVMAVLFSVVLRLVVSCLFATVIVIEPNFHNHEYLYRDTYTDFKGNTHKINARKFYIDNKTNCNLKLLEVYYYNRGFDSPDSLINNILPKSFCEIYQAPDFYWDAPDEIQSSRASGNIRYLLSK